MSAIKAGAAGRRYRGPMAASAIRRHLDLVLPREHGSWSLALEPLALGLLAAPSLPGALLGVATVAALFARRPAQFVAGRFGPARRGDARRPLVILAAVGMTALVVAGRLGGWPLLAPLLVATPAALIFLRADARGHARTALAELAGGAAFAAVPAMCALAAGQRPAEAAALAALSFLRSASAVLVLRSYLRRDKGEPVAPALAVSAVTALAVGVLVAAGLASHTALLVTVLLFSRAIWLLGPRPPDWHPRRLGMVEAALGVAFVLAAGLGPCR